MPASGAFTVTTVNYHGSWTALVTGHGKTYGYIGKDLFPMTPQLLESLEIISQTGGCHEEPYRHCNGNTSP